MTAARSIGIIILVSLVVCTIITAIILGRASTAAETVPPVTEQTH